jgi:hypothetical protein
MSMSRCVILNPVTPHTKCQDMRTGYAGLMNVCIIHILSPVNGYKCINQGYERIGKDTLHPVHRYTMMIHATNSLQYVIYNSYVRYMVSLGQINDEINHIYL